MKKEYNIGDIVIHEGEEFKIHCKSKRLEDGIEHTFYAATHKDGWYIWGYFEEWNDIKLSKLSK